MQMRNIHREKSDLDPEVCRRARLSRDSRFDGEFFLAVSTTGIYCRPICPARSPAERNVHYFRSAAQAAAAGFRPCLRCRPESAPLSPAWRGSSTTVHRALALIEQGVLSDGSLPQLAARLGVGERYLRKLFQRELGLSPLAVAHNQRLLFARKLLLETRLPISEVAYAAGFGSVRRFNSAVKETLHSTPGELRAKRGSRHADRGEIRLRLQYRPPYHWPGMLDFFSRHAVAPLEKIEGDRYYRRLDIDGQVGEFSLGPDRPSNALALRLSIGDPRQLLPTVNRIRRMFDLDAHPQAVAAVLGTDQHLAPLLAQHPGTRSPGHWSPFEAALRAVAGQQVSLAAARTVLARLLQASGSPGFDPAAILALPDDVFAMPGRRRQALREVCRLFSGDRHVNAQQLAELRGVGPWTTAMYAMRGLGDPDIMPLGDLGLEQAWQALESSTPLAQASAHWRPWRSYVANLLWRSLSHE